MRRGWRHADPDGFWGPALHYNRALGAFVMLFNRTAGGGDVPIEVKIGRAVLLASSR